MTTIQHPSSAQSVNIPTDLKEKRKFLITISKKLKPAVNNGTYPSMNKALLTIYRQRTRMSHFHSAKEWKSNGYSVKKDEVSFPIWGSSRQMKKKGSKPYTYYPMAFVFHEAQVVKQGSGKK